MATVSNKTLVYKQVPEGMIRPDVDMVIEDRPLGLTPPPRGLVVKTLVVGFDPHQRDRMKGPTFQSYVPGYVPDEPMNTFTVAKVVKSDNEKFVEGDIITGILPIAEYGIVPEQVGGWRVTEARKTSSLTTYSMCIAHSREVGSILSHLEGREPLQP